MSTSLENAGRYSLSAICLPVNFARVWVRSVDGSFHGKNTTQVSAPTILIRCNTPQTGELGGTLIARLRRQLAGCNCFLRSLVKLRQKPSGIGHILFRQSPLVLAAVHKQQSNTRRAEACSKNQTMGFTA